MSDPRKFSRLETAELVRSGALKITCHGCKSSMQPDEDDLIKCRGCGKAMAAGDRTEVW
jgi:hypothetical protein